MSSALYKALSALCDFQDLVQQQKQTDPVPVFVQIDILKPRDVFVSCFM